MAGRDAESTRTSTTPDADAREAQQVRDAHGVEQHTGGHGHSVAAWAAVGTILLGSFVACLAVVLALVWLFVVGVVVILVGAVLGKVLHAMGFGENAHEQAPEAGKQGVR